MHFLLFYFLFLIYSSVTIIICPFPLILICRWSILLSIPYSLEESIIILTLDDWLLCVNLIWSVKHESLPKILVNEKISEVRLACWKFSCKWSSHSQGKMLKNYPNICNWSSRSQGKMLCLLFGVVFPHEPQFTKELFWKLEAGTHSQNWQTI